MNKTETFLLAALIVLYVISPIDLFPGPVDDLIVAAAGIVAHLLAGDGKAA
ncbi:MAG: hypothetical protein J6Z23_06780 [Lachnospiraceae bacterium]|nr:hypothetical protein [Lachnospiraceae bacterium]